MLFRAYDIKWSRSIRAESPTDAARIARSLIITGTYPSDTLFLVKEAELPEKPESYHVYQGKVS